MKELQFLIIEDNPIFLDKLISILRVRSDFGFVQSFGDAESALKLKKIDFDIIIVDYKLPKMDGIEFLGEPNIKKLKIPKMILTGYNAEEKIFQALKNGATGYLFKEELETINSIIDILLSGGAFITPTLALHVVRYFNLEENQKNSKIDKLTKREREVLDYLSKGIIDSKISDQLDISVLTVRQHIKNIYRKLEVRSRFDLVKFFNNRF